TGGDEFVRRHHRSGRLRREKRGLAAWPRAQIEPLLALADGSDAAQGESRKLGAFILNPRSALTHGGPTRRVAPWAGHRKRGEPTRLGTVEFSSRGETGERDKA